MTANRIEHIHNIQRTIAAVWRIESAKIIGALTSHYGARLGMSVCGAIPAVAAALLVVQNGYSLRRRSPGKYFGRFSS